MTVNVDDPFDAHPLPALIAVGHELAVRARRIDAESMTAHLVGSTGPLVFTYEKPRRVWVTGHGFERELTGLPEWEPWRPPGT